MNLEFRQHKQAIRSFMQLHYTDERLAQLLAHAQSGKLAFDCCCCFIGIPTATHALGTKDDETGYITYPATERGSLEVWAHYHDSHNLQGAFKAEMAYANLAGTDAERRRILIPMIRSEIRRRDQFKTSVVEYCDVHQEAVSG